MSASSGRTFSKAKKLWNSSQLQKAPAYKKCFHNHIPKVALWVGVASAALPQPLFQWAPWGKKEAKKRRRACLESPSPAAHPQEGRCDAQGSPAGESSHRGLRRLFQSSLRDLQRGLQQDPSRCPSLQHVPSGKENSL